MWKNVQLPLLGIILAVSIVVGVKCFMRNNLLFVAICQTNVLKIDVIRFVCLEMHLDFLLKTSVRLT